MVGITRTGTICVKTNRATRWRIHVPTDPLDETLGGGNLKTEGGGVAMCVVTHRIWLVATQLGSHKTVRH